MKTTAGELNGGLLCVPEAREKTKVQSPSCHYCGEGLRAGAEGSSWSHDLPVRKRDE